MDRLVDHLFVFEGDGGYQGIFRATNTVSYNRNNEAGNYGSKT